MENIRQKTILKTKKTVYTQNEISALSVCSATLLKSILIVFQALPELRMKGSLGHAVRSMESLFSML